MAAIQPIENLNAAGALKETGAAAGSPEIPFRSIFEQAAADVQQTDAAVDAEIYKLATGGTQDPHDLIIASQKASLSIGMVVELRNKLLDAYKEIININV